MAEDLAALVVRLEMQAAEFQKGMDRAVGQMDRLNRTARTTGKAITGLAGDLKTLASAAAGFVSVRFVESLISGADEIGDFADQVNVSASSLQAFRQNAQIAGSSADAFDKAIAQFNKRFAELKVGSGELASSFKKWNQSLADSLKSSANTEDALYKIADAMKSAATDTERVRIATAAFGKEGYAMVPMLRDGADGLRQFKEEAEAAGSIMSDELIGLAGELADEFDMLKNRIHATFGSAVLSSIRWFANEFPSIVISGIAAAQKAWYAFEAEVRILWSRMKEDAARITSAISNSWRSVLGFMADLDFGPFIDGAAAAKRALEGMGPVTDASEKYREERSRINQELAREIELIDKSVVATIKGLDEEASRREALRKATRAIQAEEARADKESSKGGRSKKIKEELDAATKYINSLKEQEAAAKFLWDQLEILDKAYQDGVISTKVYTDELERLKNALGQTAEQADKAKTPLDSMAVALGNIVSKGIEDMIDGFFDADKSFQDFAKNFLISIAKMIVKVQLLAALKPVFESFGVKLQEHGGAWNRGVQMFATGGIVTRPTMFATRSGLGLMGEAGPEAIIPLRRSASGDLGVQASPVIVNVNNNTASQVSVQEAVKSDGSKEITVAINEAVRAEMRRGGYDRAMANNYGLRRRGF
jgi:hypothetical protein